MPKAVYNKAILQNYRSFHHGPASTIPEPYCLKFIKGTRGPLGFFIWSVKAMVELTLGRPFMGRQRTDFGSHREAIPCYPLRAHKSRSIMRTCARTQTCIGLQEFIAVCAGALCGFAHFQDCALCAMRICTHRQARCPYRWCVTATFPPAVKMRMMNSHRER